MSRENRLWGAPRIHGELLKLGFEVAESTVSKDMIRHRGPPSQSWRTFLRHHADVVVIPAEDGGYALIGMRTPEPALFSDVPWSTPGVMDETRRRLRTLGLTWHEPTTLWDVDLPRDLERMRAIGLHDLIPSGDA
jgi:hypothetical protein